MSRFTGGCVCGAIRYECDAEPIMTFKCHCRDCQHVTGGAYAPGSLSFISTGTGVTIKLVGTTQAGNWATALDNFTLSSVPEPATWVFMLAGVAMMGGVLRSRRAPANAV